MAPPSQRPFFANFLAAFRVHSALIHTNPNSNPSSTTRGLSTKPTTTASSLGARTSPRHHATQSTISASSSMPSTSTSSGQLSPSTQSQTLNPDSSTSASPEVRNKMVTSGGGERLLPPTATIGGRRRGSDSSSEGFRDVLGAEKLYIGGRTAQGDVRYHRLGVVKRKSGRSLSLDRLSL